MSCAAGWLVLPCERRTDGRSGFCLPTTARALLVTSPLRILQSTRTCSPSRTLPSPLRSRAFLGMLRNPRQHQSLFFTVAKLSASHGLEWQTFGRPLRVTSTQLGMGNRRSSKKHDESWSRINDAEQEETARKRCEKTQFSG